jgi:hypothetical protein
MKNFKTIALLPLDNRPPNYLFPVQLAQIAGIELLLPPREFLGDLHRGAQRDSLERWLLQLPEVDALIVAIDTFAFGGLAQSRQLKESQTDAISRLKVLLQWREQRPQVPLYAFNVLMRLGITMDSDGVAVNHFNLQRYSRLADEAAHFDSDYLRQQLAEVTAQIDPKVLSDYLATRTRNHQINAEMLRWLADEKFDFLSLVQEDCAEFGLHRGEQKVLLEAIDELHLQEKISLHPGADEAGMVLLARLWNTKSTFRVHWSEQSGAAQIPPFEDRPFAETLAAQLRVSNCSEVESDADFALFINAPLNYSRQQQTTDQKETHREKMFQFAKQIKIALEQNQRVAVCDAAFPNGADDVLMQVLDKQHLLGKLCAFAAWNTASNALGTVIAQCAAFAAGDFEGNGFNQHFVLDRILDDWIYQTRLRPQMEKRARATGVSPLNLGTFEEELQKQTEREMKGYAQLIAQRHFKRKLKQCHVTFPWGRTFEVELRT